MQDQHPSQETKGDSPGTSENTHWTLIFVAARDPLDTCAREALAHLCEIYWKPLYCFVRRQGNSPEDAEDLTQAFFQHFLDSHALAHADPAKGTFRSFLFQCLRNFMHNEWHKGQAQKRNPGSPILSFDAAAAETYYSLVPVDKATPDKIYERDCAWSLVEQAIAKLRAAYEVKGKLALYEQLSPSLMGDRPALPYREIAKRLDTTDSALRMETNRMRKELRRLLKQLLIPITDNQADIQSEFRALIQALGQ